MPPSPSPLTGMFSNLLRDCQLALPELILSGAIILFLLARLFSTVRRLQIVVPAVIGVAIALGISIDSWSEIASRSQLAFGGLLRFDGFGLFTRIFLLLATMVTLLTGLMTGIPDREDSADYVTLLLGSTVGLMFLASSHHLLMLFLSAEMASLPAYALTGFFKGKRKGSEAALKYVVYGSAASGVMLYGISLVCAVTASASFSELQRVIYIDRDNLNLNGLIGAVLIFVGLGFKLAIVPFHFWGPDAFEGAPAEVAGFLSVASKGAALAITARFLLALVGPYSFENAYINMIVTGIVLGFTGTLTATFGNLMALKQTNLKRLLAYSTIAHAGIMLLAMIPLQNRAMAPILYYLIGYLPANLGIFAAIALIRNHMNSEAISTLAGLGTRSPAIAAALTFFLLSLLGLPPLVGFITKFQIFVSIYEMGALTGGLDLLKIISISVLVIAGLNTAIGAGYYLKLIKYMYLHESPPEAPKIPLHLGYQIFFAILVGTVVGLGIMIDPVTKLTRLAANSLEVIWK
ncbi:MAG: NADH-quinone oxidoreductase subunit N [Gemmataceae bacterium]|nr:NADH-quinone oxidoreductase subunit N [Gemmataceae bacterium]